MTTYAAYVQVPDLTLAEFQRALTRHGFDVPSVGAGLVDVGHGVLACIHVGGCRRRGQLAHLLRRRQEVQEWFADEAP